MLTKQLCALALVVAFGAPTMAQNGGAGIRSGHITATGATVPRPGVPQASGPTPLDRRIEHSDDRIDTGVCRGC